MHINRIVFSLLIVLLAQSCTTTRLMEEGETAYGEGDFKSAFTSWEEAIREKKEKGEKVDSTIYYKAGIAAQKLDKTGKAQQYLEWANDAGYSSPDLYLLLSGMYKNIDNLTLEIRALESYHKKYPEGEEIDSLDIRLFETYVESEQWNKAKGLWPNLEEEARSGLELQKAYFKVNKELENEAICDKLADQILRKEPNNLAALEWNAIKYFDKADSLYVTEMKAYKENRTRKQYRKLLDAWDRIWPDFRKSRDYFEQLYELDPKSRYANYLGHIYNRMDQEQKAEKWYKRAEKGDG